MEIKIRNTTNGDFSTIEEITREAFWNLYVPGCDEHYLVHTMRTHPDYLPELDFVAELNQKIVGSIMYAKSKIIDETGNVTGTLTFGPLCVVPEYQRKGIGSQLILHTKKIAKQKGYPAIIILGDPHNYCKSGFKNSKDLNISNADGRFPYGQLVLALDENFFLQDKKYRFYYSDAYNIDTNQVEEFDKRFAEKKKEYHYTQELFSIGFRAFLD